MNKATFIFGFLAMIILTAIYSSDSLALAADTDTLCSDGVSNCAELLDINKIDIPSEYSNQILPDVKLDVRDLFDSKNLSWGNLKGILKAMATLAINIFLAMIQTLAGILKALLPFLK